MGDKFEFVIEKHQVENLLVNYLNDPTNYDWNGNLTALQNKLQNLSELASGLYRPSLPQIDTFFRDVIHLIIGSLGELTVQITTNMRIEWAKTLYKELINVDAKMLKYLFPDDEDDQSLDH